MPVVSIPVEVDIRNCDGIDLLRSLQDNSVDLILADPPYGISKDSGMNKLHERKKAGEELTPTEKKFETATKYGKWDEDFTLEDLERFVELYYKKLKPGGTCIIWFDWVKISFLCNMMEKHNFKQLRFIQWVKSSGPTGPPTIADATYAEYAYGLPEGFYENCTTTQAEAIAMFTKYNELHDPCEWTKFNGPFNCERAGPTGIGQRFSLAYANALLAYTVISATIVNIFYAKAKRRAEGKDVEKGIEEVEFVDVGPRPAQPTTQIQFADGTTLTPEQIQAKV